jgi:hypothetical protein
VSLETADRGARERLPVATCTEAIDTALAQLGKVAPRDERDSRIKNAPRSLAEAGSKCLAKAGDCREAWRRFPALVAAWEKGENVQLGGTI